jgi:hypothetical protein
MFKGVDARQHMQGYHALELSVSTNMQEGCEPQ